MNEAAPRSLFDKLWDTHVVANLGGVCLIAIDRVLLHERTGGVALRSLAEAGRRVLDPARVFATMDHIIDTFPGRGDGTLMPTGRDFIETTRRASASSGITLFDIGSPDQGIVHVISPELAIVLPGLTLVCPDSHTGTQGALGALAWGIGSSEAEHALATGTLRLRKPDTMRVNVSGHLGSSVTTKDLALHILSIHGAGGGSGAAVEYAGDAISALDMEARLTLCNLATEFAAFSALIAPDDKTFRYLKGRRYAPAGTAWDRAVAVWQQLHSDKDAVFSRELDINAADVAPMVTWGLSPQQGVAISGRVPHFDAVAGRDSREAYERALTYMNLVPGQPLAGLPIDAAFIGSCTNSRLSDLRRAAKRIDGHHVAAGVRAVVVPGSTRVKTEAESEGLDRLFTRAGFEWRESGCSMCFYAGGEHFPPNARVISSTNRNFESRQGPGVRTHLASPETVAASALAGAIAGPGL